MASAGEIGVKASWPELEPAGDREASDVGGVSGSYGRRAALANSGFLSCVWMLESRKGGGDREREREVAVLLRRSGLRGGMTGGRVCSACCC